MWFMYLHLVCHQSITASKACQISIKFLLVLDLDNIPCYFTIFLLVSHQKQYEKQCKLCTWKFSNVAWVFKTRSCCSLHAIVPARGRVFLNARARLEWGYFGCINIEKINQRLDMINKATETFPFSSPVTFAFSRLCSVPVETTQTINWCTNLRFPWCWKCSYFNWTTG